MRWRLQGLASSRTPPRDVGIVDRRMVDLLFTGSAPLIVFSRQ